MACIPSCTTTHKAKPEHVKAELKPRYDVLPPREHVPVFMKGTVWEYADVENTDAFPVSSFGLVVNLKDSGDNTGVPLAVRNYIRDEMVKHGLGSQDERLKRFVPERMLENPQTAIVEVYGLLPAGARKDQLDERYCNRRFESLEEIQDRRGETAAQHAA